jgi:D-alanyl-D-alanine carboxypeptidase
MRLVTVVLGTESMRAREDASAALLELRLQLLRDETCVCTPVQPLTKMRVWKGQED